MGTLYYGDNLDIVRRYVKDETVNLVYLDPPSNSAQNYSAFFEEVGSRVATAPRCVDGKNDQKKILLLATTRAQCFFQFSKPGP